MEANIVLREVLIRFRIALQGCSSPLVELKTGFLERAGDLIELRLPFGGVTNIKLEQTGRYPQRQSQRS